MKSSHWKRRDRAVSSVSLFGFVSFSCFNLYSAFAWSSCYLLNIALKSGKRRMRLHFAWRFLSLAGHKNVRKVVLICMQSFSLFFCSLTCWLTNWTFTGLWWLIRREKYHWWGHQSRTSLAVTSEHQCLQFIHFSEVLIVASFLESPHRKVLPGKSLQCCLCCWVSSIESSLWIPHYEILTVKPVLQVKLWLWIHLDEVLTKTSLRSLIKWMKVMRI